MFLRRGLALIAVLLLPACTSSSDDDRGDRDDGPEPNPELAADAQGLHRPGRASESSFTAFESGQVRPLALSPDGAYLYAVNTPDNRLEILRNHHGALTPVGSVVVGLEPVAVAARGNGEVWVVNHLSDSVSVVDARLPSAPRVTRTLLVGDEPRDVVFAGGRAFITAAHRGQNAGFDPQLTTPGVGRADVWAFDPAHLGDGLGGAPLAIVNLFTDTPRALAVSADGNTVYAAGFHTGNRTTTVPERIVTNDRGLPPPLANGAGEAAPHGSLIVKYRRGPDGRSHWLDEADRIWDDQVKLSLPDKDVFAIDARAAVPALIPGATVSGVGTVLFDMAVNPVSGKIYVSNLEARNDVRFEGHNRAGNGASVRGHIAESRITVIDLHGDGTRASARHLNKHLDYRRDGTPDEAARSLAFPTGLAVSRDGAYLYVAALGSAELGILRTRDLEADTFVPRTRDHVALSGGGPTGVVIDPAGDRLFVMTRFDNGISVVDPVARREVSHVALFNPEPLSITRGRRFLYDARLSSSHGDSACASCHVFGDLDSLAWDLGDPDGGKLAVPGPFTTDIFPFFPELTFHPMKAPMTTQSLRGMANHGPMHWRGDRTGGNDVATSAQPDTGSFDEAAAFAKFNPAFAGLLGRATTLGDDEMAQFTAFVLQLTYPPNPVRHLDNTLTPAQQAGRDFFFAHDAAGGEVPSDTFHNCNGCHTLDPAGNAEFGVARPGFFGSDGRYSFDAEVQFFKVPHMRNLYQKVGMFGMADTWDKPIDPGVLAYLPAPFNDNGFQGDQIRGFGFTHDGSVDTLFRFFGASAFIQDAESPPPNNAGGIPVDDAGLALRRDLEAFALAFDSNLAPIVGQQITLRGDNAAAVGPRIDLLLARAAAGECDVVVHGRLVFREVGFLYRPESGRFSQDRAAAPALPDPALRALAYLGALTFTAVPPGSGERIGLDRDSDGVPDGDQRGR